MTYKFASKPDSVEEAEKELQALSMELAKLKQRNYTNSLAEPTLITKAKHRISQLNTHITEINKVRENA